MCIRDRCYYGINGIKELQTNEQGKGESRMNKKVSLGVMISLIAVACAITFVLTMTVSLNMYNSMVAGIQERETINAKIKEIDTFVRSSSIYKPNENTLITGIANGYISGTSDKYAKYYTADEYYKLQQDVYKRQLPWI